jgi:hypothetical protein
MIVDIRRMQRCAPGHPPLTLFIALRRVLSSLNSPGAPGSAYLAALHTTAEAPAKLSRIPYSTRKPKGAVNAPLKWVR